ncbi:hypothetical protein ACFE04_014613 [Oxalis oulophora]
MLALRRASNSLRYRGFSIGASRASSATSEHFHTLSLANTSTLSSHKCTCNHNTATCSCFSRCNHKTATCSCFGMSRRYLSSQAGAKDTDKEDDDMEDAFSELEAAPTSDAITDIKESEHDSPSESELSEGEDVTFEESPHVDLDLSDIEADSEKKKISRKKQDSALFNAIISAPGLTIHSSLDKWVEEGKEISRDEIAGAMLELRKRRMYGRALQLSEWLEANKQLEFNERDYAARLDLIAKIRGLQKAESYIGKIPKSFQTEVIYRTLLANCVASINVKKAEEVFNKMRELKFPITTFSCNQLLLIYKRVDKKKIGDVLFLMEKENVKRSLFTYRILIDNRGQSNDISGMDEVYNIMKEEGIEPDTQIQSIMAKHYISGGLKDKAEVILKEIEGENLKENRRACWSLLPLYADLGRADDVKRIWKHCEATPRLEECMAAIEAWGKLNEIDEAEAVFSKMIKTWKRPSSKHYNALLKVYANHKMLNKGVNLVKQMADKGCKIGPLIWDALVKLHVEAGEIEKADTILQKAIQQNQMKPMFTSYMVIMDQYAKKGDIHNSEKIFHRMRQAGYVARLRQFQTLLNAYINAKAPAYGFRERLKADNLFPTRALAADLAKVDAFRKTAISDLLD